MLDDNAYLIVMCLHPLGFDLFIQAYARRLDHIANHSHKIGIVLWQDRCHFDYGDFCAKLLVCLCHFKADGATANDEQVIRANPVLKDGFVGKIRDGVNPVDWWNGCT